MYAVYHGPEGLRRDRRRACTAAPPRWPAWLRAGGVEVVHEHFFDTLPVGVPGRAAEVVAAAARRRINLRLVDADTSASPATRRPTAGHLRAVAGGVRRRRPADDLDADGADALPADAAPRDAAT